MGAKAPNLRPAGAEGPPASPAQPPAMPTFTIPGDLIVSGRIICRELETSAGVVQLGSDPASAQTLFLQPNCGSYDKQSAVTIKPVSPTNGALLILEPGDDLPLGMIASQAILYGPLRKDNPRRQRLSNTVFVQIDSNPFGTFETTMSGDGDSEDMRPMPVLFNYDATTMMRLDASGMHEPGPVDDGTDEDNQP